MSKFQQVMSKNPPHVFIKYDAEKCTFAYGVVGKLPIAELIGYIVRVQAELAFRNPDKCDDSMCVVVFDPNTRKMCWFVDSCIPVDALVGTLELIKCTLVDSQMASMVQAAQQCQQTGLVDLSGKPILRS